MAAMLNGLREERGIAAESVSLVPTRAWWLLFGVVLLVLGTGGRVFPAERSTNQGSLIFYLPAEGSGGEDLAPEEERQALERFARRRMIERPLTLVSLTDDEILAIVEPIVAREARKRACAGVDPESARAYFDQARGLWAGGDGEAAKAALSQVRLTLPCAAAPLSRVELAEFFLLMGLGDGPASEEWLRGALSADPLIIERRDLPPAALRGLDAARDHAENKLAPVGMRIVNKEDRLFTSSRLLVDGRRFLFDKTFIRLFPGYHYVELILDGGQRWGFFTKLDAGETVDLTSLARRELGLDRTYREAIIRLLGEGTLDTLMRESLRRILREYSVEQVYIAALSFEEDGPWISLRRYRGDSGLDVPPVRGAEAGEVPVAGQRVSLHHPWALDLAFWYSSLRRADDAYHGRGSGISLRLERRLSTAWRMGIDLDLGIRAWPLDQGGGARVLSPGMDVLSGIGLSRVLSVGDWSLRPELGIVAHLTRLRGVTILCDSQPMEPDLDPPVYMCGDDAAALSSPVHVNVRGRAIGPRARMGLVSPVFSRRRFTLRGVARLGYSPLFVMVRERTDATLVSSDIEGHTSEFAAILEIDPAGRMRRFQEFCLVFGIKGSY